MVPPTSEMFSPSVSLPFTSRVVTPGESCVLAFHAPRPFNVSLVRPRVPPVGHVAARIEAPAAVVEAVRDLVADHRADGAVIGRVVGLRVEERRLQDAGGKVISLALPL